MHADVNGLLGAYFLAVPAEDAAELIDLIDQRVAVAALVLTGYQLDAVCRANLGTQAAGYTLRAALFIGEHAVGAAPPLRDAPLPHAVVFVCALLLRVLHRHLLLEHVLEGERHSLEGGTNVADLALRPLQNLDADGHQDGTVTRRARALRDFRCRADPLMKMPLSRS